MFPNLANSQRRLKQACQNCQLRRARCVSRDGNSCLYCNSRSVACSLSSSIPVVEIKKERKKGRNGKPLNRSLNRGSIQDNRASSSITVSRDTSDIPFENPLDSGTNTTPPPEKKQKSGQCNICGISAIAGIPSSPKLDSLMVQCSDETCRSSYHLSCLWLCKTGSYVLSKSRDPVNLVFLCAACQDHPKTDYAKAVCQAWSLYTNTVEGHLKGSNLDQVAEGTTNRQSLPDQAENLVFRSPRASEFELPREEMFQGYDENVIQNLMYELQQSIYDYAREVHEVMELFSKGEDTSSNMPLKAWKMIDAGESFVTGQPWYHINNSGGCRDFSKCHAPITASLRSMLKIPDDMPLEIPPSMETISFSQVQTAFISWFVLDILDNKIGLYDFPNMKPLTTMNSAVQNFGDARWPGKGKHVLREVQLRTWYKDAFGNEMRQNDWDLARRLEAYLEPLTRKLGEYTITRSVHRVYLIEHTVKLWTYLQSLQGNFEPIHPGIGSSFNDTLQKGYDREGSPCMVNKRSSGRKIIFVLCRGFKYTEEGPDGVSRDFIFKAEVVLE